MDSAATKMRRLVVALSIAALAATTTDAFTAAPSSGIARALHPAVATRPALRTGAQTLHAVYEPAIRIGHGFDIHRLGWMHRMS